jgi:hypothetical protein
MTLDKRGRFTVEPKHRKRLGRHVLQVRTKDGLLLVPVEQGVAKGSLPPGVAVDDNGSLYWTGRVARVDRDEGLP